MIAIFPLGALDMLASFIVTFILKFTLTSKIVACKWHLKTEFGLHALSIKKLYARHREFHNKIMQPIPRTKKKRKSLLTEAA